MNKNCKYLKQKLNRTLYCKKLKSDIKISKCSNCKYKEYLIRSNSTKLKNRTSKQAKLERNRFSVFNDNINKCYFCSGTINLTWHEIYRGRNRSNSMKYGLCLRMCLDCHKKYQDNEEFNDYWHKKGQQAFITNYPELDFMGIFKINYL